MTSTAEFFSWVEAQLAEANAATATPCRAGCSWCCRGNVPPVSLAEQEWLTTGLATWDPAALAEVQAKAREIVAFGIDEGPAMTAGNLPCPLLDERTDQCRAYEHRPLACRLFGASTIEPGWHFGCDAVQLQLALSGQSLLPINAILQPFEQRTSPPERITLARFLAEFDTARASARG